MIGSKRKATRSGPHAANGRVIHALRIRKGISQEKLGQTVGVGRIHVINLENGLHLPSGPTRDRLAVALDAKPGEIASSDDEDEESALPRDLDKALQVLARYVGARA